MRFHRRVGAVVVALAFAARVSADGPTLAGPALGTIWRVSLAAPVAGRTTGEIHRAIEELLGRVDRALSTWRDDSAASRFNATAAGQWIALDPDLAAVLRAAGDVHAASGGAFDPTAGALIAAWRGAPPDAATLHAARTAIGYDRLEWRDDGGVWAVRTPTPGMRLDLGGIGPGQAVDLLGARLAALGSAGHVVCLGGECRAWGERSPGQPWRVQLDAVGPGAEARVVDLPDGTALATSTRRPGHGPIDPRSGSPVGGAVTSVTVRGPSCALADAWAVALLVQSADPGWPERQIRQLPPGYRLERIGPPPVPR